MIVIGGGQYAVKVASALGVSRIDSDRFEDVPGDDWLLSVNNDRLLSAAILSRFGACLNLHNGKLPEYAGRHVHQWAIRNGESESEATIHYMTPGVDAGDIVATRAFPIRPIDTGFSLFHTSFKVGSDLMIEVGKMIQAGQSLPRRPQIGTRRVYRHRDALNGEIDFGMTARQVVDFVRAGTYVPFKSPSYTPTWNGKPVRKAELTTDAGPDVVACRDGAVRITF